jgi:hypothetical protein
VDNIPTARVQDDTPFFAAEFGLTAEETVALMGAHNLGIATAKNSGYSGVFVTGQAGVYISRRVAGGKRDTGKKMEVVSKKIKRVCAGGGDMG